MSKNDGNLVRYSQGRATNLGKVENKSSSWRCFKDDIFAQPSQSEELLRDYLRYSEGEQKRLKASAGYWYRTHVMGAVRNRGSGLPSDLVTFDFDYATPEFFASLPDRLRGYECFIHTSRRHTPEKPRFRLVVLLASPVPNDLYVPVSRILAQRIDPTMCHVDKVSFRPAQMMFLPTVSADGEYVFREFSGKPLDWETMLAESKLLHGDWRDLANLPKAAGETTLRQTQEKAEDPTEKTGPVGDFCRAYDVPAAIAKFLPDLYIPVDMPSGKPRYTYAKGSTVNGAEVQDDGLFLYSHHGSDPVSDRLVNAFDLVRIHLFGDKDADTHEDTDMHKRPSWKAMIQLCEQDEGYLRERVRANYDLAAMFDDLPEGEEVETPPLEGGNATGAEPDLLSLYLASFSAVPVAPEVVVDHEALPSLAEPLKRRPPPAEDWVTQLEATQQGRLIAHLANVTTILSHDLRFRDSIWFNTFTNTTVLRLPIKTKIAHLRNGSVADPCSGDPLEDYHLNAIRCVLETPNGAGRPGWGLKVSDRDLKAAVNLASRENSFHPVRDAIEATPYDGVARAESLFIRYLGCPDTPYFRDACRLFLLAALTRVYEPGHKFDFVPVLWGDQGIRKSTFIATLALQWFGELKGNFRDEKILVEQMMGKWIMEIPELAAMARSEVEDVKAFLSALESHVRLSYAHNPSIIKRQVVFMGSTNNLDFLRDPTGNRRFWPIEVKASTIDTVSLAREMPQVWAEVLTWYRAAREAQPTGSLPLYMTNSESVATAKVLQERSRRKDDADLLADYFQTYLNATEGDEFDGTTSRHRSHVTIVEMIPVLQASGIKIPGNQGTVIAQALAKAGWEYRDRRMVNGERTSYYIPGSSVVLRWALEDLV